MTTDKFPTHPSGIPDICGEVIRLREVVGQLEADASEWRRKFARVVFLGNNIGQLPASEQDELRGLLAEAYAALKGIPNRGAP